jgi:hypothetical protein
MHERDSHPTNAADGRGIDIELCDVRVGFGQETVS